MGCKSEKKKKKNTLVTNIQAKKLHFSVHTRTPSLCLFQTSLASLLPSRLTVLIIILLTFLAFLPCFCPPRVPLRLCRLEFYSSCCRISTLLRGFIRFRIKNFEKIFGILGILEILGIDVHFHWGEHNVKCVCVCVCFGVFFFFWDVSPDNVQCSFILGWKLIFWP